MAELSKKSELEIDNQSLNIYKFTCNQSNEF